MVVQVLRVVSRVGLVSAVLMLGVSSAGAVEPSGTVEPSGAVSDGGDTASVCVPPGAAVGTSGALPRELVAASAYQAQSVARAMGVAVEDVSQRSEYESTFALPDGTWQGVIHSAPHWVLVGEGDGSRQADWARADRTLESRPDGMVAPRAHVNGIVLAGGGPAEVLASQSDPETGVSLRLLWDGSVLPSPVLDGGRATYKDVHRGVDLVIDILPVGLELYFVVKDRAALEAAGELYLDYEVEGASIVNDGRGGLRLVAADGTVVGHSPTAFAWDARTDEARTMSVLGSWADGPREPGAHLKDLPISEGVRVAAGNAAADSGVKAVPMRREQESGRVRVFLEVPDEWVESPSTVFPVVIDPSTSLSTPYWDTYVKSTSSSDFSTSSDLLIGYEGAAVFRSFITWNVSSMRDRDVTWAGMYLYMYHAWSCGARNWYVVDTGGDVVAQTRNWASQPASSSYGPYSTTLSTTTGYENGGCANAWVGVNITNNASRWSDFPTGSNLATVAVRASSESDTYYWKRFYSSNTSYDPYVSYSYNQIPTTPTAVSIAGTALTSNLTLTEAQVANGVTVSTTVTDPDGGQVQALFTVKQDGIVIVDSFPGSKVTSGTESTATLPYTLAPGVEYTIEVRVTDTRLISDLFAPEYYFEVPVVAPRELSPEWDDETGVA